jgi:hypothetical protein
MPTPETERLIQLLNAILGEVVHSKDWPTQQGEELRLRAVWRASEHSDEFRQFGQASAVGLETLAAEFQDVLRFMLVIGYRLRSAELGSSNVEGQTGYRLPSAELESSDLEGQSGYRLPSAELESSDLEGQSGYRLPSAELESSNLEGQSGYRLPSAELESLDLELQSGYHLPSAALDSSDLELQSGCHGTAPQTRPATCPGKYHSAASTPVPALESAGTRRRSVYQGLRLNSMAHHIRGRISLWWRCFLTWSLQVIRTDTFGEKIYLAYKKRHPHRAEPKYSYLSTPDSLSTGSTSPQ